MAYNLYGNWDMDEYNQPLGDILLSTNQATHEEDADSEPTIQEAFDKWELLLILRDSKILKDVKAIEMDAY